MLNIFHKRKVEEKTMPIIICLRCDQGFTTTVHLAQHTRRAHPVLDSERDEILTLAQQGRTPASISQEVLRSPKVVKGVIDQGRDGADDDDPMPDFERFVRAFEARVLEFEAQEKEWLESSSREDELQATIEQRDKQILMLQAHNVELNKDLTTLQLVVRNRSSNRDILSNSSLMK